jgi:hypothetical protein
LAGFEAAEERSFAPKRADGEALNISVPLAKVDELRQLRFNRCYSVYGLRLRTTVPLTLPELPRESSCDIEVLAGDAALFEERLTNVTLHSSWAQAHRLAGRWVYARLEGMFDVLLNPDGSRIFFRPLGELSMASFETHLLGLLMKAVLIKKNIHSLHASAVVVEGKAIAFLGLNGFGKSSLAASFVSAGYLLLTDDVLRLDDDGGRIWAYPGPSCLKLVPDSSLRLEGASAGTPMDPGADKWLFTVAKGLQCNRRAPLAAIYCVAGLEKAREAKQISIEALDAREALTEVLWGTNRDRIVEPDRATNPFNAAKRIVGAVPLRRLAYPWALAKLPQVRTAVLEDVRGL